MQYFATVYAAVATCFLLLPGIASACNPLTESGCAPDKALGGTVNVDFTKGASSEFTASYNVISYESDGVHLTVAEKGDSPLLVSNWYIMFGRFEIVFKSATGTGMVSSAILQSDDLDEIDWELLGADPTEAQTNYFGRGVTETYDREVTVADASATTAFSTYVVDWNEERIIWSINGITLRTLYAANADVDSSGKSEYPQSPMQIKIGPWAGGDPSNPQGTITWAGGEINYADGPYTMIVQSLSVTDYSTGTAYEYTGTDGTYKDISAIGGVVYGNSDGATTGVVSSAPSSTIAPSSVVTSTATTSVGTSSSSVFVPGNVESSTTATTSINTRTTYPWVPLSTTGSSASAATTTTATTVVTGSSSSFTTILGTSSSPSSSELSQSSVAGSASDGTYSAPASMIQTTTFVSVVETIASMATTSTTVSPSTNTVSSTLTATTTQYTGSANANKVASVGAIACVAAGLALAL